MGHAHGYGFSAGVGAGTAQVTRGLPVLCPKYGPNGRKFLQFFQLVIIS